LPTFIFYSFIFTRGHCPMVRLQNRYRTDHLSLNAPLSGLSVALIATSTGEIGCAPAPAMRQGPRGLSRPLPRHATPSILQVALARRAGAALRRAGNLTHSCLGRSP
jgi:hypothetical protein